MLVRPNFFPPTARAQGLRPALGADPTPVPEDGYTRSFEPEPPMKAPAPRPGAELLRTSKQAAGSLALGLLIGLPLAALAKAMRRD